MYTKTKTREPYCDSNPFIRIILKRLFIFSVCFIDMNKILNCNLVTWSKFYLTKNIGYSDRFFLLFWPNNIGKKKIRWIILVKLNWLFQPKILLCRFSLFESTPKITFESSKYHINVQKRLKVYIGWTLLKITLSISSAIFQR